ncbi:MAG: methyltransferase domain-containing protein [Kangiellaceae bacterium]|nr:methyltransferase domain-containing protein [Kangiellaceae bacterium]
MQNTPSNDTSTVESWDTYWRGASSTDAFSSDGVNHPAIPAFWQYFFGLCNQDESVLKLIDIACGNGSVIECASQFFNHDKIQLSALDISAAAIKNLKQKFPFVKGIVSDANNIALDTESYDIVTSQFGVEYAGLSAILETSRLVTKGGKLGLLFHIRDGSIHQECEQNKNAINSVINSRFVPLALRLFKNGFAAMQGADRSAYESAARELAPAIKELESIMTEYGLHIAGDTVSRLYNDVDKIHKKIQHYNPDDVFAWLESMENELPDYLERMKSMVKSSLTIVNFETIKDELEKEGFVLEIADKFFAPNQKSPLAWVLIANKQ